MPLLAPLYSCISLYSYIKPQPQSERQEFYRVVYLYIPTSNHNLMFHHADSCVVVYLYIPTSNHNKAAKALLK